MNNKNYDIYFDCGFSKLRAGALKKLNLNQTFYTESKFLYDHLDIDLEIKKIITLLEKSTNEYIDDINLMIDSPKMLSIGISISKKIDDSELRKEDIQFLVQKAKQQILKHYKDQNIVHIIINNYNIDKIDYDYLPRDTKCNFVSLDILFICLPIEIIEYFKKVFYKFDISINQITCSSYAKAINYKNNLHLNKDALFVDVGFNKTSITTYISSKIVHLNILPIGGNHITKDISKVLKIDLEKAEKLKINFSKNGVLLKNKDLPLELLKNIIYARTEEILKKLAQSIGLNSTNTDQYKMVLMGDGSKILHNLYKEKTLFVHDIDFLKETGEDICKSGFKLVMGSNKQEVIVVPKKQIKQGFFEKLFHLFK